MKRHASVNEFIEAHPEWRPLLMKLRKIPNASELTETVKWGAPVYTLDGKKKALKVSPELSAALSKDDALQKSYSGLTPFKQREYADYITAAKRAETKQKRLTKILPMIRQGIGLNDKYRNG